MAKPKTLEQLRAEKERAETQLAQEQHKLERLENRKKYLEKGERTKRTHRHGILACMSRDFDIFMPKHLAGQWRVNSNFHTIYKIKRI